MNRKFIRVVIALTSALLVACTGSSAAAPATVKPANSA